MTTRVVLTGTGVPHVHGGCAGAGALVEVAGTGVGTGGEPAVALQFDAGRATVLRLAEAGVRPRDLAAVFVTHFHSDHVVGLPDLALTRWIEGRIKEVAPLTVVAPEGKAARFVERMLDAYDDDIAVRRDHVGTGPVDLDRRTFPVSPEPIEVWASDDGRVRVRAVAVHHEPVDGAVAFRVDTPDGAVVISGDTRVCGEVEALSAGADVVVHEACRTSAMAEQVAGTPLETIFDYHADTVALGEMAARAAIPHLVLTHLIPPAPTPEARARFEADVRSGGYQGRLTVGHDLTTVVLG